MRKSSPCLRNRLRRLCAACVAVAAVAGGGHPACATDAAQLNVGLKTLLSLPNKSGGATFVAVLFDPQNPASQTDAEAIVKSINSGEVVPSGLKITAQAMTVSSFDWNHNVKAAFVADGVPAQSYAAIARVSAVAGVLTMSADLACVKAQQCVLGIRTSPRVTIYYSPEAAEAARLNFAPAFVLLAQPV